MDDTSYANSIEIYLERCRGDVWTVEMKDRNQKDLELFAPFVCEVGLRGAIAPLQQTGLARRAAEILRSFDCDPSSLPSIRRRGSAPNKSQIELA